MVLNQCPGSRFPLEQWHQHLIHEIRKNKIPWVSVWVWKMGLEMLLSVPDLVCGASGLLSCWAWGNRLTSSRNFRGLCWPRETYADLLWIRKWYFFIQKTEQARGKLVRKVLTGKCEEFWPGNVWSGRTEPASLSERNWRSRFLNPEKDFPFYNRSKAFFLSL